MVHNAPGNSGRVVGGERTWRLVRTKEDREVFCCGERDAIAPSYRRGANDPTRRAAREKRGSSPGQALPFQGVDRQRRTPAFTAFSRDQTNNSPTIEASTRPDLSAKTDSPS